MASLSFAAHCQRDHDRIDFTDRAVFEAHMTKVHKARRPAMGLPDAARPGGLPSSYLRRKPAPKTSAALTKVLHAATASGKSGYPGWGPFAGVYDDWQTDQRIPAADLRVGDLFEFGRREYTVLEVHGDTWTVSGTDSRGEAHTAKLDAKSAARLRDAGTVVVLKRVA